MERYIKNLGSITLEEQKILKNSKVCIVGCGGLGGYNIEMLSRLGIGFITIVDGDTFDESNLNRQILSDVRYIGQKKADEACKRICDINPNIEVRKYDCVLDENNWEEILSGHDIIVDSVDGIKTRFLLQNKSEILKTPLVFGAIGGWYGQVGTIFPGDRTLDYLYSNSQSYGMERNFGNPSFIPALVGSIQVSEVLKFLIKRGELLRKKILFIDLFEIQFREVYV